MRKLIYLILVVYVASSCVKDYPEGIGEQIVPAPEGFEVTSGGITTSSDNVNFDEDSVYLIADFNSTVSVSLKVEGQTSGAVRNFTTLANKLDASNAVWFGEFDPGSANFFQDGEEVTITMSFFNFDETYSTSMTIDKALSYRNSDNLVLLDPRPEGPTAPDEGSNGFESPRNYFWWFDTNTLPNDGESAVASRQNEIKSVQGDYYLELKGKAPSTSSYIGGASYGDGSAYNPDPNSPTVFYDLPADPDQVWFNIYVYGEGNTDADLYIEMREADSGVKSNGDPEDDRFRAGRDDGVQILQKFSHRGWKLFSYKYSTLPFASYCLPGTDGAGCGTKQYDSNRIKLVAFSLESSQKERAVSAKIDYAMFTVGGPFDPVKFRR